jgi:hypothetical protein
VSGPTTDPNAVRGKRSAFGPAFAGSVAARRRDHGKRWGRMGKHDVESIRALTDAIEDVAGL